MTMLIEKPLEIARDHYLLKFDSDTEISFPGQFASIRVSNGTYPLLRRPFSIFNHYENIMELVIKVVGIGTKLIRDFSPGPVDIMAPLGKGFTICENKNVLLIGGGVGNAPLYYLAGKLKQKENKLNYVYAARSKEYIYKKNDYAGLSDNFFLATDDGTDGEKGLASDIVNELIKENQYERIYICGPTPMMKSITEIMLKLNVPVEVSLENYFGCGIGLCYGCAVNTSEGIKRACVDGPVFNGNLIKWNEL